MIVECVPFRTSGAETHYLPPPYFDRWGVSEEAPLEWHSFLQNRQWQTSCHVLVFSNPERKSPQGIPYTITNSLLWLCRRESTYVQMTPSHSKDNRVCGCLWIVSIWKQRRTMPSVPEPPISTRSPFFKSVSFWSR